MSAWHYVPARKDDDPVTVSSWAVTTFLVDSPYVGAHLYEALFFRD